MHRHTAPRLAAGAIVAIGAVVLAGCSTATTSGGSGSSAPVSVGIPVADVASLQAAGVASPDALTVKDIEKMYTAAIDAVSGKAAAGGHKITTDFASFDLVQPGAPQTACLHFVQDSKDQLVLSDQFVNGGDQCVVQRGGFLIQNIAAPQAAYAMAGKVVTTDLVPNDAAAAFARYLTTSAHLKGKKLAVLTDALGGDAAPVTSVLIPALKKAGLDIVHVTTLSADLTQVAQQIPVEVSQLQDAGVDEIIDATPSANLAQFLGGMSKAGLDVPLIASDLNNAVDEAFAAAYPKNLKATALTARRFGSDNAQATACASRYQKAGGRTLVAGSANYQTLLEVCDSVTILAAGLKQLGGTTFSSASFAAALGKVGTLDLAYYGPSKLSGSPQTTVQAQQVVSWGGTGWAPTDGKWIPVAR